MIGDDELRDRLRRTDPAAALEPAAPEQVRHLMEDTMSRTHTRRWAAPVAATLVLIAGGAAWAALGREPQSPAPTGAITASVAASEGPAGAAVRLQLPAGGAAKCMAPDAGRLAEHADFAFAGTVTTIDGEQAGIDVTRVYRGSTTGQVEVTQPRGSETLLGAGQFEKGKKYLIAASGGSVMICGYSGEADAIGLRDLYETAF